MEISMDCDICLKRIKVTPTVRHTVDKDGLLVLCKACWTSKGLVRDRYSGQIQQGYYLATN